MTQNLRNPTAVTAGRASVWGLLLLLVLGAIGPLATPAFGQVTLPPIPTGPASYPLYTSDPALDAVEAGANFVEDNTLSGFQAGIVCLGGPMLCGPALGSWNAGRTAGAVGDATREVLAARNLEPGPDGCWRPFQYHSEDLTVATKYGQQGCERGLLPAWRWRSAATELTTDFSRFDTAANALHVLSRTLLLFAGFLWSMLLAVLEWALTADLALHSHGMINSLYLVTADAVTNSALVPIIILLLIVGVARSALRSDTRRVIGAVVTAALFLGAIHALADRAAEEPATTFSVCDRIVSDQQRAVCNEQLSSRPSAPPAGSPGWFAWQGVTWADTITHELVEPFTATDGFLSFQGAHAPTNRSDISCAAYVDGLYHYHAATTGLDGGFISAFGARNSEGMLRLASRLWESGYLSYWKLAQFGVGSDAGEDASCFLLETNARVHPGEQQVFANYAWDTAPAVEAFDLERRVLLAGARTTEEGFGRMFAWSACSVDLSGGSVSFSENSIWTETDGCADWWSSGSAPAATDVDPDRLEANRVEVEQVLEAWSGTNHTDRLFAGFFSVFVALIYLWTFGAMALGSLAAQIGIIVMMLMLPLTLLLLALPQSAERSRRDGAGMRMLRLTGSMFLAKLALSVALALTFVVTGLIQSVFITGLGTSTSTGGFGTALPLAFTGQSTIRSLLVAASPLIALFLIRKLFKTLGFNSITSISGALTFPLAAAAKAAGDQKSVEKIQQSVPQFGKSAKKWAGRGAKVVGAAALGTGLVGAGLASTDTGKRGLARVTAGTRESASELFHALNDPNSKLGGFRQSLNSLGTMATMFGTGRARQAGFKLMAANKLVEPGGLLDTIGISRNQLGERVPLDDDSASRTISSNNPGEEPGRTGELQSQRLRARLASHDNPDDRQDILEEILAADARSRTTSWNPSAYTDEEQQRLKQETAQRLGLSEAAAAHMYIAPNGKAAFDPTQDWEKLGVPEIARLASVAAATSTTKEGEATPVAHALMERWDPHDPNKLQRYVETSELVTHALGGAVRDATGRLEVRSVSDGGLDLQKLDDRALRDITRYVDSNADARLEHQAMAVQVSQALVNRAVGDVRQSMTPDGSLLQLTAAQQELEIFDQLADQVSGLTAAGGGAGGNAAAAAAIRGDVSLRLREVLKQLSEAQLAVGTAVGAQAMATGDRIDEVQHLGRDLEDAMMKMRDRFEQQLSEAAQHAADGNQEEAEKVFRSISSRLQSELQSVRVAASRELPNMESAMADAAAALKDLEYEYPQHSSRQPALSAGGLRSMMTDRKQLDAVIDSLVVSEPQPARRRAKSDSSYPDDSRVPYSL